MVKGPLKLPDRGLQQKHVVNQAIDDQRREEDPKSDEGGEKAHAAPIMVSFYALDQKKSRNILDNL